MYKIGQGMISRIGILVLCVLLGFYSGYKFDDVYGGWLDEYIGAWTDTFAQVFLTLLISAIGFYISFILPKSVDFLIDMDVELRKVIWPETQPLFSQKAEAWGATYVVIITVIVMTAFIYAVDIGLEYVIQKGILDQLFVG